MDLVKMLVHMNPQLKRQLRTAHMPLTPEQFVKRNVRLALYVAFVFAALAFFAFSKSMKLKVIPVLIIVFVVSFFLINIFFMQTPNGTIKKREKEINREVLFLGRYLLVKMESGTPLFNSLIDASKTFGGSGKYFREIVDEINTGTPIEDALENAREYNASEKFKKILWQIIAALKTGTDVTGALRSTLRTIGKEQMIEVKEYGKKLNSLMLFYMIVACIGPSLGIAMFIIIASFLQLAIGKPFIFGMLFGLMVVQVFFIIMIKASRPAVDM